MGLSDGFLHSFTESMKKVIDEDPSRFYDSLSSFEYFSEYNYDSETKRLSELKEVLDKILSIVYKPYVVVKTSDIVIRSEQSGSLSHDSFMDTMRDSKLWREKRGTMVPENVHSVETIDSIDNYENRFISMLIKEIDDDIDRTLNEFSPFMESIEEHYQHKETTFGLFSSFHDMRKNVYPYESFFLKENNVKDDLLAFAKKIKRRAKNLKGTEFYRVTSQNQIKKPIMPTNVLIHDKLYSYCYRYYMANYKRDEKDERKNDILYFNYFIASFMLCLKKRKLLKENNVPIFSFDDEGMLSFDEISFDHYPFAFSFKHDKENIGLNADITIVDDNGEKRTTSYYLLFRTLYSETNAKTIENLKNLFLQDHSEFILVTENNVLKEYSSVITFSYHKENNLMLIEDLLSSMTILFAANKEIYSGYCPMCGHEHIRFDGDKYVCNDCKSTYSMMPIDGNNLLWIESFRKE